MTAVGETVPLTFQVADAAGVPTDPSAGTLTFLRPDGGTDTFNLSQLTHGGTGAYSYDYIPTASGPYGWTFQTVDPSLVLQDSFVVDGLITTPGSDAYATLTAPWITPDDVARWPNMAAVPRTVLAGAARAASEILYMRSGRQFPGLLSTTVRPTMQPHERNLLAWAAFQGAYGYTWQGSWSPLGLGWGSQGWGTWRWPPAVDLGVYPIRSIVQVKLDGTVIPADEYRIDDHKWLVRVRPSSQAVPTDRYGWPTTQALDLPDTEEGTFSVSCIYGTAPPASGQLGAAALAAHIAGQSQQASGRNLPTRTQSVTRAGVSIAIGDTEAWVSEGLTGVYEADLFLETVNPGRVQRRPIVWSPDIGHSRRAGV